MASGLGVERLGFEAYDVALVASTVSGFGFGCLGGFGLSITGVGLEELNLGLGSPGLRALGLWVVIWA